MENQDLLEALDFINPGSLTYEEWTMVGMGLKQAGFPVTSWEQWSARDGGRYHRGECARKWGSFHGNANPVTENSIFKLARDHGWAGPAGYALDWNDVIDAPAGRSDGIVVDPHWLDVQELAIPAEWDPADQLVRYLQALFEPEEHVAYVTESYLRDGRPAPTKGCWDRTAGQLIEELRHYGDIHKVVGDCDAAAGAWICFNPVEGGRNNDNVTDYRYALVECDNLELEKQQAIIRQLELPCAARRCRWTSWPRGSSAGPPRRATLRWCWIRFIKSSPATRTARIKWRNSAINSIWSAVSWAALSSTATTTARAPRAASAAWTAPVVPACLPATPTLCWT